MKLTLSIIAFITPAMVSAFQCIHPNTNTNTILTPKTSSSLFSSSSSNQDSTTSSSTTSTLQTNITKLKKILELEYTTFFNPMYTNYYSPDVTFDDPMTSLSGVQSYQNNVDMLASRTPLGKILFDDASISLHSVTGGEIIEEENDNVAVEDLITRWTLRMTVSILPWKPTARFTGISVYKVQPTTTSNLGITIVGQTDYWDSINIQPNSNGNYNKVDKGIAINDFLDQLKPNGFQAQSAAPELPYQLLRRGDGYEGMYISICIYFCIVSIVNIIGSYIFI